VSERWIRPSAVADDLCRDALPQGRPAEALLEHGEVGMRVDVDDSGSDDLAGHVDDLVG